jgi:hypothetical protein
MGRQSGPFGRLSWYVGCTANCSVCEFHETSTLALDGKKSGKDTLHNPLLFAVHWLDMLANGVSI